MNQRTIRRRILPERLLDRWNIEVVCKQDIRERGQEMKSANTGFERLNTRTGLEPRLASAKPYISYFTTTVRFASLNDPVNASHQLQSISRILA